MKKQIQVFFTLALLTSLVNTAYSQISKEQLNKSFEAQKTLIEGSGRDCYPVNTVVGDLNGDGKPCNIVVVSKAVWATPVLAWDGRYLSTGEVS